MNTYDIKKPSSSSTPPPIPKGSNSQQHTVTMGKHESVMLALVGLAAVFFAIMGMIYLEKTLVSFWVPAGIAVGVAIVSLLPGIKIWKALFPIRKIWVAALAHTVFAGVLVFFLIMCVNYTGTDFEKGETVTAEISGKFIKERTRTNRGRRHHGGYHTKYNTWHIELTFPDGRKKELQISHDTYYRLRNGGHIELKVARGSLGMDVIEL